MLLSAFSRCGFLRCSGKDPLPKSIYLSMKQQKERAFDMTVGGSEEAETFADAMAFARVRATLQRAGNQCNPRLAYDCLPLLEQDYLVTPGASDTVTIRQGVLVAKELLPRGAVRENVVASLRAILGTSFLSYRPVTWSEGTLSPTYAAMPASTQKLSARVDVAPKFLKLRDPVTTLGAPVTVRYSNLDAAQGDILLVKNDAIMVQPGHYATQEAVTVTAAAGAGATKTFTATFANSHDVGAAVTTMNFPWQTATSRHNYIIVIAAAAVSAESRRKIDELMSRILRGVSTWSIVQPTSPGALTIGPDVLPYPLGAVPIGTLAFALSS